MEQILVTGGNGFIASWIIKYLLDQGHTVNATVRSLQNQSKISHLIKMEDDYPGKLNLFEANLMVSGSFDQAMKGCAKVIHCASPFIVGKIKKPYKELLDPAVKGTENVLGSVNKTQGVKRVVLTSSVVAIWGDASDIYQTKDNTFDESYWNESSKLKEQPYYVSKVLAEKKAWEIYETQNKWELAIINPGFVLGPSLQQKPSGTSQAFIEDMIQGKNKAGVPSLYFGCVDVRDVAKAHIKAMDSFCPQGRYIVSNEVLSMLHIAKFIEDAYPNSFKLPKNEVPKFLLYLAGPFQGFSWNYIRNNIGISFKIDNTKSRKTLGLDYYPIKTTLKDQVQVLTNNK